MGDNNKNYLILGHGLLGKEIFKQTGWDFISREKDNFDFLDLSSYKKLISDYDTIINCIAYCNTYDKSKENHWNVNYKAVVQLVDHLSSKNKKLIHIGTDQLYTFSVSNASEDDVPVHANNWYSYCKNIADAYVQLKMKNYLIFRGSHKEKPFQYDKGMVDMIGNFDYVDVIAKLIIKLIEKNEVGVFNIGTEEKSAYDLGIKTKKDLEKFHGRFFDNQPLDLTMNLKKLKSKLD